MKRTLLATSLLSSLLLIGACTPDSIKTAATSAGTKSELAAAADTSLKSAEVATKPADVTQVTLEGLNKRLAENKFPPAQHMAELHEYMQKSGDVKTSMVPVVIEGAQFFAADGGDTLVSIAEVSFMGDNGMTRGADLAMGMVFSQTDVKQFPSLNLKEGVAQRGEMFVFTDPTCGYCQHVDKEIDQYLSAGVKVTYIPYPRAGIAPGTPGLEQWVRAMCTDNPAQSYHEIIMGKALTEYPEPTAEQRVVCSEKVAVGFQMGQRAGLRGTPYMILAVPGKKNINMGGYVPAEQMLTQAGLK